MLYKFTIFKRFCQELIKLFCIFNLLFGVLVFLSAIEKFRKNIFYKAYNYELAKLYISLTTFKKNLIKNRERYSRSFRGNTQLFFVHFIMRARILSCRETLTFFKVATSATSAIFVIARVVTRFWCLFTRFPLFTHFQPPLLLCANNRSLFNKRQKFLSNRLK